MHIHIYGINEHTLPEAPVITNHSSLIVASTTLCESGSKSLASPGNVINEKDEAEAD